MKGVVSIVMLSVLSAILISSFFVVPLIQKESGEVNVEIIPYTLIDAGGGLIEYSNGNLLCSSNLKDTKVLLTNNNVEERLIC